MRFSSFKIVMLAILLITAVFIPGFITSAQTSTDVSSNPALTASIPFDLSMNLVFIQVWINEKGPFEFILDSGFEGSAINKSTLQANGWPMGESHKESAPGGEIELSQSDSLHVSLSSLDLGEMKLMVIPLDELEPIVGRKIDGILGYDFFDCYTLEIDYQSQVLSIYDPSRYRFSGNGQMIPITLENNEAFIFAVLESGDRSPVRAKLKLDTGSADFLGLNGSFLNNESLFEPTHKKIPAQGAAVGGATENYITRLANFKLGDIQINEPLVGYSVDTLRDGDAGTIGGEFFSRFTVTFDYTRHRLILKKNEHFDSSYNYDMSGIFPIAKAPDFKEIEIASVALKSPGSEAGLQAGDIILSIDGKLAGDFEISEIRQLFTIDGNRVNLEIERGGKKQVINLVLRKLI